MPDLNLNNLELLLFFVAPGFISLKVWGILNSAPRFQLSESLIESVVYNRIAKIKAVKNRITPTAWDHYFSEGEDCFVLIHMKADDEMIGGLFSGESFASSYPEKENIYLEELWKVDKKGRFKKRVESTNGLLVNFEEIKYIEFFRLGTPIKNITPVPTIKDK